MSVMAGVVVTCTQIHTHAQITPPLISWMQVAHSLILRFDTAAQNNTSMCLPPCRPPPPSWPGGRGKISLACWERPLLVCSGVGCLGLCVCMCFDRETEGTRERTERDNDLMKTLRDPPQSYQEVDESKWDVKNKGRMKDERQRPAADCLSLESLSCPQPSYRASLSDQDLRAWLQINLLASITRAVGQLTVNCGRENRAAKPLKTDSYSWKRHRLKADRLTTALRKADILQAELGTVWFLCFSV